MKVISLLRMAMFASSVALALSSPLRAAEVEVEGGTPEGSADGEAAEKDKDASDEGGSDVQQISSAADSIGKMADQAKKDKDVVLLNCVNDKHNAAKGALRSAQQAQRAIRKAKAERDDETIKNESEKIAMAKNRAEQLLREAGSCVGGNSS